MKKIRHITLLVASTLLIAACGTTTSITGSYKAPGVTKVAYKKIFIAALTPNTSNKQKVENGISDFLAARGVVTSKSFLVFPPDFHSSGVDKDKDVVLRQIRTTNCDGILTIALVNKETETRYVPGSGPYPVAGFGYYGTFGAYYGYGYSSFYSPGYYTDDKVYYLETNLYDATTEKLIWSAQSKTYNPSSIDSFLQGYEKAIAEQIIKDGVVAPAAK